MLLSFINLSDNWKVLRKKSKMLSVALTFNESFFKIDGFKSIHFWTKTILEFYVGYLHVIVGY